MGTDQLTYRLTAYVPNTIHSLAVSRAQDWIRDNEADIVLVVFESKVGQPTYRISKQRDASRFTLWWMTLGARVECVSD